MSRYTQFRPRLRSRHPSHDVLRPMTKNLPLMPFKSVIRLGSTTDMRDTVSNGGDRIEINTIEAIKSSANKRIMKSKFSAKNVKTATWWDIDYRYNHPGISDGLYTWKNDEAPIRYEDEDCEITFPLISKSIYGSRGTGNIKHDTREALETWMEGKDLSRYIFEEFKSYVREYRLHITKNGCFYACRKVLRRDTPEEHRWYRNDDYCNWIREDSENQELFDKPVNWDAIVEESVKALNAVGLDVGAVDVKVQSATNGDGERREDPEFFIIEINSAPSFGDTTAEKYIEILPELLNDKFNNK